MSYRYAHGKDRYRISMGVGNGDCQDRYLNVQFLRTMPVDILDHTLCYDITYITHILSFFFVLFLFICDVVM